MPHLENFIGFIRATKVQSLFLPRDMFKNLILYSSINKFLRSYGILAPKLLVKTLIRDLWKSKILAKYHCLIR